MGQEQASQYQDASATFERDPTSLPAEGKMIIPADSSPASTILTAAQRVTRRAAILRTATGALLGMTGLSLQLPPSVAATAGFTPAPSGRARTTDTFVAPSRLPSEFSLPAPLREVPLDPGGGFDLPVGRFRATFIPRAGLLGPGGDPEALLKESMVMGMIITCREKIWWIESEPAGGRAFNLAAYSAGEAPGEPDRTAILSGKGGVSAGGAGLVEFALQTVSAMARSEHHDQIAAAIMSQSDGTYAGQVSVIEGNDKTHGYCHHRCKDKSGSAHRRCHRRCRKNRRH